MTTVTFDTIGTAPRSVALAPSIGRSNTRRALGWSVALLTGAAIWGGIIAGVVGIVSTLS